MWRKDNTFRKRQLNFLGNSITVFDVLALCMIKIGHIRALYDLSFSPTVSIEELALLIINKYKPMTRIKI